MFLLSKELFVFMYNIFVEMKMLEDNGGFDIFYFF